MNWFAAPFLGAGIYFLMQWAITGDTLQRHEKDITALKLNETKTTDDERKARAEMANKFLEAQQKQIDALNKLDVRLAITETKTETTNQKLGEIAQELSRITSVVPRR